MLNDTDRIFTNIYGWGAADLKGAKARGDWNKTAKVLALGHDEIVERMKASGLRGRGGRLLGRGGSVRLHLLALAADLGRGGRGADARVLGGERGLGRQHGAGERQHRRYRRRQVAEQSARGEHKRHEHASRADGLRPCTCGQHVASDVCFTHMAPTNCACDRGPRHYFGPRGPQQRCYSACCPALPSKNHTLG